MYSSAPEPALNQPELLRRVNALRRIDNVTNWFYLAREYLFLAVVLGLTVAFYHGRADWGLAWAWNVPVTVAAVVLVGVGQHRLATLGHEASHYLLFRNRLLNELASNWFCMFSLLSLTHNYRLQHLAHHQYVNDPERDPDHVYMRVSGYRFRYPMPRGRFWWDCVIRPLLWVPALIEYILIRAVYAALGGISGPYRAKQRPSRLGTALELLYLGTLVAVLAAVVRWGEAWQLGMATGGLAGLLLLFSAVAPESVYLRTTVKPTLALRWWSFLRLFHVTLLFTGLAWLTQRTGEPWWLAYFILWLVPLGTTFSYLMMLREEIQHSNAGRERFKHTRIFEGNPLVRWAVFPLGMDYHLPHHLFPLVPHYRLKELHALLLEADAYRRAAVVVEGYLVRPPTVPSALHPA